MSALLKLLDIFWTVHKEFKSRDPYVTRDIPRHLQQHRALLEAIARRDVKLAQERLVAHFEGVRGWISLEKQLGRTDEGAATA